MANSGYDCQTARKINFFSPSESASFDTAAVQRAEMFTTVVSATVSPRVVLGVIWTLSMLLSSQAQGTCEPLTIPLCQGLQLYNDTVFPNMLNHSSQREAAIELYQFAPLVTVGCSIDLAQFLCSVYAPYCLVSKNLATPVPPCRSLCTSAKQGCEGLMKRFGFSWPNSLRCDRFPKLGEEICVDGNGINKATVQPPTGGKTQLELTCQNTLVCRHNLRKQTVFQAKTCQNFLLTSSSEGDIYLALCISTLTFLFV